METILVLAQVTSSDTTVVLSYSNTVLLESVMQSYDSSRHQHYQCSYGAALVRQRHSALLYLYDSLVYTILVVVTLRVMDAV
jgi:hypothetical protein